MLKAGLFLRRSLPVILLSCKALSSELCLDHHHQAFFVSVFVVRGERERVSSFSLFHPLQVRYPDILRL